MNETLYKGVMVDIETTGLSVHRNFITSIGAVRFEIDKRVEAWHLQDWFHVRVDGLWGKRYPNLETLKWRRENGMEEEEAKIAQREVPRDALLLFNKFIQHSQELGYTTLVANHPEFDVAFLKTSMEDFAIEPAWKYYNVCDLATLKMLTGYNKEYWKRFAEGFTLHDALEDCKMQLNMYRFVLQKFQEGEAANQQHQAIRDDMAYDITRVAKALGVSHEPHQSFSERLIEAAQAVKANTQRAVDGALESVAQKLRIKLTGETLKDGTITDSGCVWDDALDIVQRRINTNPLADLQAELAAARERIADLETESEQRRRLLNRAIIILMQWNDKYMKEQPSWLPPAHYVTLMEDYDDAFPKDGTNCTYCDHVDD